MDLMVLGRAKGAVEGPKILPKISPDSNQQLRFFQVFDLFWCHCWHLDNCPCKNPQEINPDVLGYIFEKYIKQ